MYTFAIKSVSTATEAGIPVSVCEGEIWDADDQIVKAFPDLFSDTPVKVRRTTVAATKKTATKKTATKKTATKKTATKK